MSVFFSNSTQKKAYFCRFKKTAKGEGFIYYGKKNKGKKILENIRSNRSYIIYNQHFTSAIISLGQSTRNHISISTSRT